MKKEETKETLAIAAWKEKYNKVVCERNSLERSINSYKGENTKLRNRVKELREIQKALCDKNEELRTERNKFEQKYISADTNLQYYLALPWYKKIFVK